NRSKSWADFMNGLFAMDKGLLYTAIPDEASRVRFVRTKRFKNLRATFDKIVNQYGWVEGASPKLSAKRGHASARNAKASRERQTEKPAQLTRVPARHTA